VTVRPLTRAEAVLHLIELEGLDYRVDGFVTSPPHCKGETIDHQPGDGVRSHAPAVAFFRGLPGVPESRAALPKA